ncbi:MAG: hypothetical protein SVG88_04085 [Halobacteriales archaeon]|nr:hypothetical protein [Halobacteriales archaeon]
MGERECQEIWFKHDDTFPRFRISDECGDDDVGVDSQLHSSSLSRFLVNVFVSTLDYFVGIFLDIVLAEIALASEFVHPFERFDFFFDGLSCDLTSVDLWMSFHPLFEVVVHVDCDTWHTENYVSTEYCALSVNHNPFDSGRLTAERTNRSTVERESAITFVR